MRATRSILNRPWPAALALAMFIAGTNYCVVAALAGSGSRSACAMQAQLAVTDADAPAAPCCNAAPTCHAQGVEPRGEKTPARGGPAPCCITLAPVASAPDAGSPTGNGSVAIAPDGIDATGASLAPLARVALPLDTGPPAERFLSTASSRAPPLA